MAFVSRIADINAVAGGVVMKISKLEQLSMLLEDLLLDNNCTIKAKGPNILLIDNETGEEIYF